MAWNAKSVFFHYIIIPTFMSSDGLSGHITKLSLTILNALVNFFKALSDDLFGGEGM